MSDAPGATPAPQSAPATYTRPVIAVVGNPNTGKSTLFSRLTGVRQKVGNYPGVTVEKKIGRIRLAERDADLVDLPGSYSLAAHSPDEMIAVDVLLGRVPGMKRPDAVLVVVDASNLRRNLFLASQVLELGVPVVLALNMVDVADQRGIVLDPRQLGERLGCAVVPIVATARDGKSKVQFASRPAALPDHQASEVPAATSTQLSGFDDLRTALGDAVAAANRAPAAVFPELTAAARELAQTFSSATHQLDPLETERALLDVGSYSEERLLARADTPDQRAALVAALEATRNQLAGDKPIAAVEAARRYQWIFKALDGVEVRGEPRPGWSDRIDSVLTHPVLGLLIFVGIMFVVFQAVFTWSGPLMDLIDGAFGDLGQSVGAALGEGAFSSLVEKGIIAGVGSVLIFLPQILILFLFIAILEDSGYMARAAFLTDRMMRLAGLSGQSFVPLLSSFACAIPGIMAARTIPDRKDRLTTILVAPLMSCSARLPVYTILISSFVPNQKYLGGWLSLQGLVMAAMYFVGIFTAMAAAVLIKRFMLRGPAPAFLMEMPPYRRPMLRAVAQRLWERGGVFVRRAGTIIFAVVLVVWVLSYFPRPEHIAQQYEVEREALAQQTDLDDAARADALADIDHREARDYLEQSAFGRIGHFIEPLFRPLGWDWRISAAAMASFPAREVVVAVLGTTFAVGDDIDVDDDDSAGTMRAALQNATWPDGRKLFNLPVALSLMVFFALCLQCGATVAAIKREANSWGWAIFAWCYMTGLAWVAACVVYQASYALLM